MPTEFMIDLAFSVLFTVIKNLKSKATKAKFEKAFRKLGAQIEMAYPEDEE